MLSAALQLLKLFQYLFALPNHIADYEHIFSMINAQQIKERN